MQGIAKLIEDAFARRIRVTERGRSRYRSVFEIIVLMLWTKATQTQNKRALRVLYQFEAFAAKRPVVKVIRSDDVQSSQFAKYLEQNAEDFEGEWDDDLESEFMVQRDDAASRESDPYVITAGMDMHEAAELYQRFLREGNETWEKRESLKRRRYTSSW